MRTFAFIVAGCFVGWQLAVIKPTWMEMIVYLYAAGFLIAIVSIAKSGVAFIHTMNMQQRMFFELNPVMATFIMTLLCMASTALFGTLWFLTPRMHFRNATSSVADIAKHYGNQGKRK